MVSDPFEVVLDPSDDAKDKNHAFPGPYKLFYYCGLNKASQIVDICFTQYRNEKDDSISNLNSKTEPLLQIEIDCSFCGAFKQSQLLQLTQYFPGSGKSDINTCELMGRVFNGF